MAPDGSSFNEVAATVPEIMAIVSMVAPHTVGEARTLPLPLLVSGRPSVVVLHFAQPALARKDLLYAPHQRTIVDLEERTVLSHEACTPSDFGVPDPPRHRFTSFGLSHVPDEVFWRSRDEVWRQAPVVWRDFFAGRDDEEGRARAATFLAAFERCTYVPLLPYLRGAAPEFFAWLERSRAAATEPGS